VTRKGNEPPPEHVPQGALDRLIAWTKFLEEHPGLREFLDEVEKLEAELPPPHRFPDPRIECAVCQARSAVRQRRITPGPGHPAEGTTFVLWVCERCYGHGLTKKTAARLTETPAEEARKMADRWSSLTRSEKIEARRRSLDPALIEERLRRKCFASRVPEFERQTEGTRLKRSQRRLHRAWQSSPAKTRLQAAEELAPEFGFSSGDGLLMWLSRQRRTVGVRRRRPHTRAKRTQK
jgi:hypothetical protein